MIAGENVTASRFRTLEFRRTARATDHVNEDDLLILELPWTAEERRISHRIEQDEAPNEFTLVNDDGSTTAYSHVRVDQMSDTQRARLFARDPEMKPWWHGQRYGARGRFRLTGGYWISKDILTAAPVELQRRLWNRFPDLLQWYVANEQF